jgi:branched-chain amino acid aminotransferase
MGLKVEERKIHIEELLDAYKNGVLDEAFGTGTAATIAMIKELKYKDQVMLFDVNKLKIALALRRSITDIREGRREDKYGWMWRV